MESEAGAEGESGRRTREGELAPRIELRKAKKRGDAQKRARG